MNRQYEEEAPNQEPQQQKQEPEHEQVIQRLRSQSASPLSPELEDALRTGSIEHLKLPAGTFWNLFQKFGPILITVINNLLSGSGGGGTGTKPAPTPTQSGSEDEGG